MYQTIATISVLLFITVIALLVYAILLLRKLVATGTVQCTAARWRESALNENTELPAEIVDKEKEFLFLIDKAPETKRLYFAQHCFNRLPSSFALLEKLWLQQKRPIAEVDRPAITRREQIGIINEAIDLYRKNCSVPDIEKADGIAGELEDLAKAVLEQMRQEEENELSKLISELEEKIQSLGSDADNGELLETTEKTDRRINKNRLELYPGLKTRYGECSSSLMEIFKNGGSGTADGEKVRDYNRQAIRSHKSALEKYNEGSRFFGKNMFLVEDIVRLVGGWENEFLYPSTLIYINSVYISIFSKLKTDDQLRLTELMIKEKKKEL